MKAGLRAFGVCLVAGASALAALERASAQQDEPACSAGSTQSIAEYKVEQGEALPAAIPEPLAEESGDAERGLEAAAAVGEGNCIACHHIGKVAARAGENDPDSVAKYGNHGEIGPPLNGVGGRFTEAELRMIVVDPRKAFPGADTVMPAYHVRPEAEDVIAECRGRAMISAQTVEDIVAFLAELK